MRRDCSRYQRHHVRCSVAQRTFRALGSHRSHATPRGHTDAAFNAPGVRSSIFRLGCTWQTSVRQRTGSAVCSHSSQSTSFQDVVSQPSYRVSGSASSSSTACFHPLQGSTNSPTRCCVEEAPAPRRSAASSQWTKAWHKST